MKNYTIIDSKDYELKGISEKYRKHLSHHVMHAVNNRIDVHMEIETVTLWKPSLLQKIRILKYKGGFIPPFIY